MTRLLITGGSSYLGRHLVPHALQSSDDVLHTYYRNRPRYLPPGEQLDLRDGPAVRALIARFAPDVIIHTAGSNRPAKTMGAVIRLGARHVTEAAQATSARLIHISTDVIFDGLRAPYREEDPPRPIHAYGWAKADAEKTVARYQNHVIVRTSLIYGLQRMDRGTSWLVDALKTSSPVTLFVDQFRNPIWVHTLCRACLELAAMEYHGILHVAGRQRLSRAEFGRRMLDWWGIKDRETLSFGPGDAERWPADCTLDVGRALSLLKTPLPGVDAVLDAHESGLARTIP